MRKISIKNIVKGYVFDILNINDELNEVRAKQCFQCPLLINNTCNKALALQSVNEEFIKNDLINASQLTDIKPCNYSSSIKGTYNGSEYVTGCGCGLDKKRRVFEETCPLNLWKDIDNVYLQCEVSESEMNEYKQLGVVRFAKKYNRKVYGTTSL